MLKNHNLPNINYKYSCEMKFAGVFFYAILYIHKQGNRRGI